MQLSTLSNGLRVVSRAMPGIETVAVGLFADVGSRHEDARINGIAHLFEHMVFKGAGRRNAGEISEAIEEVGGDLNACTERDATSFTASLMAEHLPLGIEIIADLVLRPQLTPRDLDREKQVVLQELGEARDTPNDIIFDDLWSAAYAGQPLGRAILGDEESIEAIALDDLHRWRNDHYRGGGMILAAAGKVDHDVLVALAESHFADLPDGDRPTFDPATFTAGSRVSRAPSDQAHLTLAYPAPAATADDYFAARLFADIVGGGMSSRLFQEVREDRGLAYSIYSVVHPFSDTGLFYTYAATAKKASAEAAQIIDSVIAEAAGDATQRELDRVRTQAKAGLLMSLETPWGQASYAARQLAVYGRLIEPDEVLERLAAVKLDDIRSAGSRMIAGGAARATIGVPSVRAA
ncbi:insulinase family protein [Sphingomonas sp. HDW15A]|uniref:M16 family metallopeptidase n=1 Tax=Sphingomonas sp. HDW15A TaxID=2714942 RepID=UPI00140E23F9|nr:pitrilysin family protein [Sphingomonas sp. HDW15A]QIK95106.1 insulinase family protein [Sphingomonas sp. HDW15A]